MLGIGTQAHGQPRQDLPPPLPHGVRHPGRGEFFVEAVEPARVLGARCAEKRTHLRRRDAVAHQRRVAGLEPQRHLAADRLHAACELADPRSVV